MICFVYIEAVWCFYLASPRPSPGERGLASPAFKSLSPGEGFRVRLSIEGLGEALARTLILG